MANTLAESMTNPVSANNLMHEGHPFTRPFGDDTHQLTVVQPYDAIGPYGELQEYTWRMQHLMNAMIDAGLVVEHLEEMYAEYNTYWYAVL